MKERETKSENGPLNGLNISKSRKRYDKRREYKIMLQLIKLSNDNDFLNLTKSFCHSTIISLHGCWYLTEWLLLLSSDGSEEEEEKRNQRNKRRSKSWKIGVAKVITIYHIFCHKINKNTLFVLMGRKSCWGLFLCQWTTVEIIQ